MKQSLKLLMVLLTINCTAQQVPVLDWESTTGSQNFFYKNVTERIGQYVYVAGATQNGNGDYDLIISKYDNDGFHLWTQTYAGSGGGNDAAGAVAVDGNGNVYVGGSVYINSTRLNDMVLIQYNSSGVQQWVETYNGSGSGDDGILDIVEENGNTVFVTGTGRNGNGDLDFITIAYDNGGNLLWDAYYDESGMDDAAHKIIDEGPEVIVYGAAQFSQTEYNYTLVSYDKGTGNQGNVQSNSGGGFSMDQVTDITSDQQGNIYITGGHASLSTGLDYYTVKYDSTLSLVWSQTYNSGSAQHDMATSVKADANGNVYVTGFTTSSSQDKDYLTIKYNSSGVQQWSASYNGAANGADSAAALVLDGNNIYVSGSSYNGSNYDYLTIKYDSSGDEKWEVAYNGIFNGDDRATNMAIDTTGGIIVSGTSWNDTAFTYRTIKYTEVEPTTEQDTLTVDPSWGFVSNNGQLLSTDQQPVPYVKFYNSNARNYSLFFSDTAVSYVLIKGDSTSATQQDSTHRVDMKFSRALVPKVSEMEPHKYFNNYYFGHIENGRTRVPIYKKLMYRNVWQDIQIEYEGTASGLVYYVTLNPGADTADVSFTYEGADSIRVDTSGQLLIYTSLGVIVQDEPRAWELNGSTKTPVAWEPSYVVTGNDVSFTWGNYTATNKLVLAVSGPLSPASSGAALDNIWWSSYYGNTTAKSDFFFDVAVNDSNYSFVGGRTFDQHFPITTGAQQTVFGGSFDGVIVGFSNWAEQEWATFVGGSSTDEITAVAFNHKVFNDRIYCIGTTVSSPLNNFHAYPSTNPSNGSYWKGSHSGYKDAFIVRLDESDGSFKWLSYYGGAGNDEGRTITVDAHGDVYFAGNTTSTAADTNNCQATTNTDFPLCNPGLPAYFQNYNAGAQDIFLAKFDTTNTLKWSTFWGSDAEDIVHEIKYGRGPSDTGNDNIYIVGRTAKSPDPNTTYTYDGSPTTTGEFPFKEDLISTTDYFLAGSGGIAGRFDLTGEPLWSTAVSGTYDIQAIAAEFNDFFCFGRTNPTFPSSLKKLKFDKLSNALNINIVESSDMPYLNVYTFYTDSFYWGPVNPKIIDATQDSAGQLYVIFPSVNHYLSTVNAPGMYYKSSFTSGSGVLPDYSIIAWDINDQKYWATYIGGNETSSNGPFVYAINAEFPSGIAAFTDSTLYIAGYGGPAGYPPVNPADEPSYPANKTSWYYVPNGDRQFDGIITRFNILQITASTEILSAVTTGELKIYPNPSRTEFTVSGSGVLGEVRV